jgi:hypothetical protein
VVVSGHSNGGYVPDTVTATDIGKLSRWSGRANVLFLFALAPLFYASASRGTGVGAAVAVGRLGSVIGPLYAAARLSAGGATGAVLLGTIPFVGIAGTAAFLLAGRPQSDA